MPRPGQDKDNLISMQVVSKGDFWDFSRSRHPLPCRTAGIKVEPPPGAFLHCPAVRLSGCPLVRQSVKRAVTQWQAEEPIWIVGWQPQMPDRGMLARNRRFAAEEWRQTVGQMLGWSWFFFRFYRVYSRMIRGSKVGATGAWEQESLTESFESYYVIIL